MNCDFDNIILPTRTRRAFTFMEVIAALTIVSVITFGVLVVINRSVASMIEGQARIQAFELARENMETLLASDSVSDMAKFGTHQINEDVQWETVVESFNEPVDSKMWIRAVCTASYMDKNYQRQTIRLEHWLTGLSATQEKQILDQQKKEQEFLENMDGNPYGDDPDGLMKYSKALTSMGDYAGAAEALQELIDEYPDSPLVELAVNNMIGNAWAALSEGDTETAGPIIEKLKEEFPENKDVQKLPHTSRLIPGYIIPPSKIPPKFQPDNSQQPDKPNDNKTPDIDDSNPGDNNESKQEGPPSYKGWSVPDGFYTWPQADQNAWRGLVDMVTDR